ncbi:MAG: methionyl-tRNA formyltransferase [Bacillota bacterium]
MDIVFMGSPDFAVNSLEKLAKSKEINIKAVVTQPDRKKGRGQKKQGTAVKKKAVELGLDVLTTNNVNKKKFKDKLEDLSPQALVVVAFGQKLSKELLNITEYGAINLHASLLPKYRGSSPIHQAIINGDKKTGVTTMYMNEELDKGDIIYKKEIDIKRDDTVGCLHDKLANLGADLLLKTLIDIEAGKAKQIAQNDNKATYAPKINKNFGRINWEKSAEEIYNFVRGVNPWPGAYSKLDGKILKIWKVSLVNNRYDNLQGDIAEVIKANTKDGILVQTGDGLIRIDKLQLAGKKKMKVEDFLRGNNVEIGKKLG